MGTSTADLDAMSCAELLHELARLTSEQDSLQAQVGAAPAEGAPADHVAAIDQQHARMARISELLTAKHCAEHQE